MHVKEIKIRTHTDLNIIKIKAIKAKNLLNKGYAIRINIYLKVREIKNKKQFGYNQYELFLKLLPEIQIIEELTLNGKILTALGIKKNDYN